MLLLLFLSKALSLPTQQEFSHPTQAPCACPFPYPYSNSFPSGRKTFCDGSTISPGEPAFQYADGCALEILGCSSGFMIETEELKDAPSWIRYNTTVHCRGEESFNRVFLCDPKSRYFYFVEGNKFIIYSVSCF